VIAAWQKKPLIAPPLDELRSDLPEDARLLIQRCLDIDPAVRPTPEVLLAAIPMPSKRQVRAAYLDL
jgi:hypothetical protein